MTIQQFRSQLLCPKVLSQADASPSLTNPAITKSELHRRLLRQITTAPNEDGYPADREKVNQMYVDTFNREFEP